MKKILISTMLFLAIAMSLLAFISCGEDDEGELRYESNGDGTCYVAVGKGFKGGDLIIPSVSPDGDKVIGFRELAFQSCTSLTSVTIPDSITSIYDAFDGCTGLTNVTIPNSITCIGNNAFSGCSSLTNVTIPDSVTSIGGNAFYGCSSLTNVTIPDSVTSIDSRAFAYCSGLENLIVSEDHPVYKSIDGNLYSKDEKSLVIYAIGKTDEVFSIPNGVEEISSGAFSGCVGLTSIVIPKSFSSIGNGAFSDCTSLTSITIPNSVSSIGNSAFSGCTSLTSITIPNSVKLIDYAAFEDCSALISVTLPDSLKYIDRYAFDRCTNLTNLYITNIASWCTISFGNSSANPLYYADNLYLKGELIVDLVIPEGVTKIPTCAFSGLSSIKTVVIPDSVTSIGSSAFEGCTNLTTINYRGSKAEWEAISKGDNWDRNSVNYTINYIGK